MRFETALVAGDVVRIGFPDNFRRWGSTGTFRIRMLSNDYTATSTDTFFTEAGARLFIEDTGFDAWYQSGESMCFSSSGSDCTDVGIELTNTLSADTPYEIILQTQSNSQPNSGSYGPFKVSSQGSKVVDAQNPPAYDFNGAFGYVQSGPAMAASNNFVLPEVWYNKEDDTWEKDNKTLFSNYIKVNNKV